MNSKTECNPGQATAAPYTPPRLKVVRVNGERVFVEDPTKSKKE